MSKAKGRAFTSPGVVLLAMDWGDGAKYDDFLGFSILRSPGFNPGEKESYLLNKIGFTLPVRDALPNPSNLAPFQKFLWWDGGIGKKDQGKTFRYTITPVRGTGPDDLELQHGSEVMLSVVVPKHQRDGISTWFNRAVVSSQAFSREFPAPRKNIDRAMAWLANGLQDAFSELLSTKGPFVGAIYHLTDKEWVIPAMKKCPGNMLLSYENRANDQTSVAAIKQLTSPKFRGAPRSKTKIMHHKFLVDVKGGRVLMGSANFTPEGLTSQANLLHIFDSPALADLYAKRQRLLTSDPTIAETANGAAWSKPVKLRAATVRLFFSPEPKNKRVSLDTVVKAVQGARSSVMFCMFTPTDPALIKALLGSSDRGKLLFGLLNKISDAAKKKGKRRSSSSAEVPTQLSPSAQVQVTLYHRSRRDKKVISYDYFHRGYAPASFLPELSAIDFSSRSTAPPPKAGPRKNMPPAVHIHHKFIIIDAETDAPTVFTGSANLSNASTHDNDENLLEITRCTWLAELYLAEFMRLYEHYRARALWSIAHPSDNGGVRPVRDEQTQAIRRDTFTLKRNRDAWVRNAYKAGTPDFLARTKLAG